MQANDIKFRSQRIKLVLTDNEIFYAYTSEAMKRVSIRDGMGAERLRDQGIATDIISRELSSSIKKSAEKLGIQYLYLSIKAKDGRVDEILDETGFTHVLTAAPSDTMPKVKDTVFYRCNLNVGHGAFRVFAGRLLAHRCQTFT